MRNAVAIVAIVAYVGYHVAMLLQRRDAYLASGLGPVGSGSAVKDVAAFALLSLPRLVRYLTTGPIVASAHAAALEGYHQRLQLNQMGGALHNLTDSPHFAENFYFWASLPNNNTEFVLSTRLSFYGKGGAHVVPWFSISYKGEQWNLPDEFESTCEAHDHAKDPRVAHAKGLGELYFEVVTPLKRWTLSYKGLVQNEKTGAREHVDARFDLEFSDQDVFLYQVHWDELAAALALAQKPWTRQVLQDLRSQNQERYASRTHKASGQITFGGGKQITLPSLLSSRDHNWGIRDWLYIYRYLWWPPIHFASPIVIDGVAYTYFLGSFVEYGITFSDLIVGGLVADDGHVASFSGATPLKEIAPAWFAAQPSKRGQGIGAKLVPAQQTMTFGLLQSTYALHVRVAHRGPPLWSHSFLLIDGDFEIHEAQALFEITLTAMGSTDVLAKTTAQGLWEFGAPLAA